MVVNLVETMKDSSSPSTRVRHSAKFMADNAAEIVINQNAIGKLARLLAERYKKKDMSLDCWKNHELHPKTADLRAVDWIFLVDTLNFSFWSESDDADSPDRYTVDYKNKGWTGYWSCCAAVNRALDEGLPVLNADFLAHIDDDQVRHIFRTSKGVMPMLVERAESLREVGKILQEKYGGSFANCIYKARNNSQTLLELILTDFPCFRDECIYKKHRVSFYKRAQILVADIWACFEGKDLGAFFDIDQLTIFADYRIPQVLNYFGLTTYSENLQKKLDANQMLKYGDDEEMEIRGCTIHVCELLVEELNRVLKIRQEGSHMNAIMLDFYLWDYGQLHEQETKKFPYHKVRCIYY